MKKQMSYLLLCATLLGQVSMTASALTTDVNAEIPTEQTDTKKNVSEENIEKLPDKNEVNEATLPRENNMSQKDDISENDKTTKEVNDSSVSVDTNAGEMKSGSNFSLNLHLTNNSGTIPAGTKYVISISPDAIDYSSIQFENPIDEFFTWTADPSTGEIIFTVKNDIVGEGTSVDLVMNTVVTGVIGGEYDITSERIDLDGTSTAIDVTNNKITIIKDDNQGSYGFINEYWGISSSDKGNFVGQSAAEKNLGIFSRANNRLDIFGEINTVNDWGAENGYYVQNGQQNIPVVTFTYDNKQELDSNSIQIINETTGQSVTQGYTLKIDEANHKFTIVFDFNAGFLTRAATPYWGLSDVLKVSYSTYVKDASLIYTNDMEQTSYKVPLSGDIDLSLSVHPEEVGGVYDNTVVQNFSLNSKFSEEGNSSVFPTLVGEDQRFPLYYLDENNAEDIIKKIITAKDTIDGNIDQSNISADISQIDFTQPGVYPVTYTAVNSKGIVGSKTYNVTLYIEAGEDVTAKYVDTEGNKISDDVVKSGNIGEKYTTEQKAIDGYTFKEMGKDSAAVSGDFTDKAQTVTYVYTKNPVAAADVTAKYVDTEGNEISDDVVKSGNIGEDYTTEQKEINGYTFKEVQGNASGKFTDKAQTVTYIYEKNNETVPGEETSNSKETESNSEASTSNSSSVSQHNDISNSGSKYLPTTGEKAAFGLSFTGLSALVLAGYYYFKNKK